MTTLDVTVCIPSIPTREVLLRRAVDSVSGQSAHAKTTSVAMDYAGDGAAVTRNRAAEGATTEWLAFLDDDDEFLPHHLETLMEHASATDADYVFADFMVPQAPGFRLDSFCYGVFDPENPMQTTITIMVKRWIFEELGGYTLPAEMTRIHGDVVGEDYDFTKRCVAAGVHIHHVPFITWYWHHHGGNTSGRKWNR